MEAQDRKKVRIQDINTFRAKLNEEFEKAKEGLEIELRKSSVWRIALRSSRKQIKALEKSFGTKLDERGKIKLIYDIVKKVVIETFGEEFVISLDRFYQLYHEFKKSSRGRILPEGEEGKESKRTKRTKANEKEGTKKVEEATAGGEKKSLGIFEGLEEDIRQALRKDLK